jgi:Tfp pilus assembly PilM family ATPase
LRLIRDNEGIVLAKIIAIDWDPQQLRVLECESRGSRVLLHKLTTLALGDADAAESDSNRAAIGQALAGHDAGTRVIGLVGRTLAVLRDLRVPAGPPEELPGMVRFQAMRELSFQAEQAAIDYEVIGVDDDGQQRVILAALQQDVVDRYAQAVAGARLKLERLGLRPYATWRSCRTAIPSGAGPVLVVSLAGESLELTVASGESVLFSRATLLRGASESAAASDPAALLVSEVRRTLAAFANQMPGIEVKRVIFPACPGEHEPLTDALAANLAIPVDRLDPFSTVELARGLRTRSPEEAGLSGAFVAAIGAALAADETWPIDFLNPKKPAVERDRRKPRALVAAAAAAIVLVSGFAAARYHLWRGDAEIQRLTNEQAKLKQQVAVAAEEVQKQQAIQAWAQAEINSLAELRRLTEQFPDTRKLFATDLVITRDNAAGGTVRVELDGAARERVPISEFHTRLNMGDDYSAQPKGAVKASPKNDDYRYSFKSAIAVRPPAGEPAADAKGTGPAARSGGAKSPAGVRDVLTPARSRAGGTTPRRTNNR